MKSERGDSAFNSLAEKRSTGVPATCVDSSSFVTWNDLKLKVYRRCSIRRHPLTCTEHILCDRVIIVDFFALFVLDNGYLRLVQVLCPCIVQVLPFSPSNNRAFGTNGKSLVLGGQTRETNISRRNDFFW